MAIDKEIKEKAIEFYNTHKEHFVDNPVFEICVKKGHRTKEQAKNMSCSHCNYFRNCSEGKQILVKNENIVEELIDFVLKKSKK